MFISNSLGATDSTEALPWPTYYRIIGIASLRNCYSSSVHLEHFLSKVRVKCGRIHTFLLLVFHGWMMRLRHQRRGHDNEQLLLPPDQNNNFLL